MKLWFPVIAICIALPASAEIYKCRLANGKTEISNLPCATGSGTLTVRPDEHVSEAARRQAERDVERMRDYVEKREAVQHAEEAAERQERSRQQPVAAPIRTPRNYGSAEECRRDMDQMALEAGQRAQMEAECQAIAARPQTVYVPVYVSPPPRRVHAHPAPAPKPAPPSAPKISAPLIQK